MHLVLANRTRRIGFTVTNTTIWFDPLSGWEQPVSKREKDVKKQRGVQTRASLRMRRPNTCLTGQTNATNLTNNARCLRVSAPFAVLACLAKRRQSRRLQDRRVLLRHLTCWPTFQGKFCPTVALVWPEVEQVSNTGPSWLLVSLLSEPFSILDTVSSRPAQNRYPSLFPPSKWRLKTQKHQPH